MHLNQPVRGYDYRLAAKLAPQPRRCTRLAVSARKHAVNAGKRNGAVSEYCAPYEKSQNNPVFQTIAATLWFNRQYAERAQSAKAAPIERSCQTERP